MAQVSVSLKWEMVKQITQVVIFMLSYFRFKNETAWVTGGIGLKYYLKNTVL